MEEVEGTLSSSCSLWRFVRCPGAAAASDDDDDDVAGVLDCRGEGHN